MSNVLTDEAVTAAAEEAETRSAHAILHDTLARYELESLSPLALEMLLNGDSPEAVLVRLRETEEFRTRFAGNQGLIDRGLAPLSPGDYLAREREMAEIMAQAGMPAGFYDSPEDFAEWIGGNVSSDEVAARVSLAATAARSVNPEVRNQLAELYGVGADGDGDLIAYYLDPTRAQTVFEQRLQLEAAELSGASVRTLGQGLERSTAEQMVRANIQPREIGDRLRGRAGLVNNRLVGESSSVSATQVAQAEFGFSQDSMDRVRRLRNRRTEAARNVGGALASQSGIVGLGVAQSQA